MNEARSNESCRRVSCSPAAAEQDLLVRHQAAQPDRVHPDAVDLGAARAVQGGGRRVRDRAEPGVRAAPRRSARPCAGRCRWARRPCPGGAARSPRPTRSARAACAANRISSTAPMREVRRHQHADAGRCRPARARTRSQRSARPSRWCRRRRGRRASTQASTCSTATSGHREHDRDVGAAPAPAQVVADVEPARPARGRRPPRRRGTTCAAHPARRRRSPRPAVTVAARVRRQMPHAELAPSVERADDGERARPGGELGGQRLDVVRGDRPDPAQRLVEPDVLAVAPARPCRAGTSASRCPPCRARARR